MDTKITNNYPSRWTTLTLNQAPGNAGGAEIIINYYENFNYQILSA